MPSAAPHSWLDGAVHGRVPYVVCMVLSLALYANTFGHQFALDDAIVIGINEQVAQGVRGIPGIFREDVFDSYNRLMNSPSQLAGGRYRPLSVSTFAIEQEFIGTRRHTAGGPPCWDVNGNGQPDAGEDVTGDGLFDNADCLARGFAVRHIDNALLYGLTVCLLYHFLSTVVFVRRKPRALLVALLFLAHPVHVEAVANVKSRDEILACLFVLLTLQLAHRFGRGRRPAARRVRLPGISLRPAVEGDRCHAARARAAVAVPVPRPEALLPAHAPSLGGMLLTFGLYAAIRFRFAAVIPPPQEAEILKNYYLLATPVEAWATKLFVFFKYAATLVFPHPLCSDYGYRSIPYKDFSSPGPWLGILGWRSCSSAGRGQCVRGIGWRSPSRSTCCPCCW